MISASGRYLVDNRSGKKRGALGRDWRPAAYLYLRGTIYVRSRAFPTSASEAARRVISSLGQKGILWPLLYRKKKGKQAQVFQKRRASISGGRKKKERYVKKREIIRSKRKAFSTEAEEVV